MSQPRGIQCTGCRADYPDGAPFCTAFLSGNAGLSSFGGNMRHLLCPSMNCANFDSLRDETRDLDNADVDIFHMDICDGELAPRWSMGIRDIQAVRRNTDKLMDVHLYVNRPMRYIEEFANAGADIIYVFPESEHFVASDLCMIKELGKAPGLAVGWGTSVESISALLPLVDYVMVNTANPVSKSRIFMDTAWVTLQKLVDARRNSAYRILCDGAISLDVMKRASSMGVDGFSMGTQCLFGQPGTYRETVSKIRAAIDE